MAEVSKAINSAATLQIKHSKFLKELRFNIEGKLQKGEIEDMVA
jgi:hypothetical protein